MGRDGCERECADGEWRDGVRREIESAKRKNFYLLTEEPSWSEREVQEGRRR